MSEDPKKDMLRIAIGICLAIMLVCLGLMCGCEFVLSKQETYKQNVDDIPREKLLSFESTEAMNAGATANSLTAAKVYYQGTDPKSEDAKFLYDLSMRFLGFFNVNMDFDLNDPESVKKIFQKADAAITEKEKNIDDLKNQVQEFQKKVENEQKYAKIKEEEVKTWKTRLVGFLGSLIALVIVLGIIQGVTGIPLLTGLLGGIRALHKTSKQTVAAVQEWRSELKEKAKSDETAKELLAELDKTLDKHQDEHVKKHIRKMKG